MNLLLDTCVFLWFITFDGRLPKRLANEIQSPENRVWLSVASFWEVIVKHQVGKLVLPVPPAEYIPKQRKRHGIESLALEERATAQLAKLPDHHKDPFDRMLICQAIEHAMVLITPDSRISAYPVKTHWFD